LFGMTEGRYRHALSSAPAGKFTAGTPFRMTAGDNSCSGNFPASLGFAEAVEEVVEEDAEDGVDDAGDEKTHGEPWLRLSEE